MRIMDEKCGNTSKYSPTESNSTSLPLMESTGSIYVRHPFDLLEPTTSRSGSMSQLQEDEFCVTNSQHDFNEALDDETSTSGVLETYEISSSNSLPTDSEIPVDVVAVEDSSSTHDTLKDGIESDPIDMTNNPPSVFNSGEVFIINDEDDENNRAEEDTELVHDHDDIRNDICNTSQLEENGDSCNMQHQLNGVIMAADGSKIFLETPVVEEQVHHMSQISKLTANNAENFIEMSGKPKRLSDEFTLEESRAHTGNIPHSTSSLNQHYEDVLNNINNECGVESISRKKGVKSEQGLEENSTSESSHDRMMSFHLKKMSLTNSSSGPKELSFHGLSTMPTSSHLAAAIVSNADIESMDLIERSDFETEQRLTGGLILRSKSVMDRNIINLSLIKSCADRQTVEKPHASGFFDQNAAKEIFNSDDWPSSSCNRAVSSDSKCVYKDISSTPTTSRKYNSRLTKSTSKINLCSSLCDVHQISEDVLKLQRPKTLCESSSVQTNKDLESTCPKDADSYPSTSSAAGINLIGDSSAARTEIYTNTNSNDNYNVAAGSSCQQNESHTNSSTSAVSQQNEAVQGCSRTSVFSNSSTYEDNQPSTSSARCQYAPSQKSSRQVNASAQTNERYLSRPCLPVMGAAGINLSNFNSRSRRRTESSNQNQRNCSDDVILVEVVVGDSANASDMLERGHFNGDDSWADCDEENNCSEVEEICTCHNSTIGGSSHGGSNTSLNETIDLDGETYIGDEPTVVDSSLPATAITCSSTVANVHQRKRKYNDGRLLDSDYCVTVSNSGGSGTTDNNSRKRIAYDNSSTPRSSQTTVSSFSNFASSTPPSTIGCVPTSFLTGSPIGRRTPRSVIPIRDNPSPELQQWLAQFQRWCHAERLVAVDRLIEHCNPSQVRHMMKVIEPQFQRDFISLLPRELALSVLSYLEPKDLLRAAQTCRSWRFLCDDNLLWKEKCRKAQILTEPRTDRPKRGRAGNMPPIASPWKAAYMRQHIIEMNWRSRCIRKPKVLKGHDDHVITCLQFSGNRIVSGSDDNTLKVWSAVTGRCLRTLVGHTGGVWSSQMSGNIIISGSTDRTLKVWDMESGHCVHTLQGHTSTVRCMHLHGNKVVSGSRDATLRVWDIEQGTCLHVLVGHLAAVRCVQYDGKLIVSGAYDYMVKIWHPERQECLHTLQGHTNRVYSLQFDGIHVVSGSLDTSIRVWDVETGNCKHTLMGHQSLTSGMELRQNILVSGNADSTVKVWDITTGQCLQTLSGPNKHQSAVTCLQFNSRFVVTSSDDGTVKLWDVKTGEFIRNLVALDSGGSGGVVWRIRANDTKLICAVGSRNGTEETKLMVLDFDVEGACVKCS